MENPESRIGYTTPEWIYTLLRGIPHWRPSAWEYRLEGAACVFGLGCFALFAASDGQESASGDEKMLGWICLAGVLISSTVRFFIGGSDLFEEYCPERLFQRWIEEKALSTALQRKWSWKEVVQLERFLKREEEAAAAGAKRARQSWTARVLRKRSEERPTLSPSACFVGCLLYEIRRMHRDDDSGQ